MLKYLGFLDGEAPLDNLLVGYFSKVLAVFMRKKPEETASLFRENAGLLPKLLCHCSSSLCIVELLINILGAGTQVMRACKL